MVNLQPNQVVLDALNDQSAALVQAEASVRRVFSTIEMLENTNAQDALKAVYVQIASAIVKTGKIPEALSADINPSPENRLDSRVITRNAMPGTAGILPAATD